MEFLNKLLEIISSLRDYSFISAILRLFLAVLFGTFVGFERERHGRAAGLRTHILVCLGATIATLIGHYNATVLGFTADPMRIGAQVVSGIGFLGVGTIISKGRFQVTGLTTAAGLWATAAIGLATGIGFYEGAFFGTLLVVLTMTILSKFDSQIIKKSKRVRLYIETKNADCVSALIDKLRKEHEASGIQVTVPRSGISGNVGIETTVGLAEGQNFEQLIAYMGTLDNVVFALPSI